MENDRYYVERCLDGHPDDFRHLVRRYQPVLLVHLAGKLGNRDRAEEAAQETLVRAYFGMDKLRKPESFFAWLLGIADLVAKEQQRKESIRRKRESVRAASEEALEPELSQDGVPKGDESPLGSPFSLEAAVAALPEAYRTVILLRYYGGLSCTGIAAQLDMPLGTVTKTLSRAYALLRDSLQGQTVSEVQQ
jgi:RNA polymerase sigma-70 factor, ECF subfamily